VALVREYGCPRESRNFPAACIYVQQAVLRPQALSYDCPEIPGQIVLFFVTSIDVGKIPAHHTGCFFLGLPGLI